MSSTTCGQRGAGEPSAREEAEAGRGFPGAKTTHLLDILGLGVLIGEQLGYSPENRKPTE